MWKPLGRELFPQDLQNQLGSLFQTVKILADDFRNIGNDCFLRFNLTAGLADLFSGLVNAHPHRLSANRANVLAEFSGEFESLGIVNRASGQQFGFLRFRIVLFNNLSHKSISLFIARGPSPLDVTSIRIFESRAREKNTIAQKMRRTVRRKNEFFRLTAARKPAIISARLIGALAQNGLNAHFNISGQALSIEKIHKRQKKPRSLPGLFLYATSLALTWVAL